MHRNQSVNVHQFAMVPRADIPRSTFQRQYTHKTTFDASYLIPVYVDEVLPGDTFQLSMTGFARLGSPPIVPIMDNLYLDSFFFFIPNRLVWTNWQKFMGQQDNPGDSISYSIPQINAPATGWTNTSLGDYFGLPVAPQISVSYQVSALPFRCYNRVYNSWFKDENLINAVPQLTDDGPDPAASYTLLKRGKRHDYFTSALPFAQKGTAVTLPLGTSAPVKTASVAQVTGTANQLNFNMATTGTAVGGFQAGFVAGSGSLQPNGTAFTGGTGGVYPSNLYADLSSATAATINQLRQSFQIQKLLERDARGGTRYVELVKSHFGVTLEDYRAQRPVYLGGGSSPVSISEIPQTSATDATTTLLGTLAAKGLVVHSGHGFTQSFTEHGHILGLVSVRADLNYSQGIRRMWSRLTRYDFYFPVFAMLGEQTILNKEIYFQNTSADSQAFGYIPRWDEYRYFPSMITGHFRSNYAQTLDYWHLAQNFAALPSLNQAFIEENVPMQRVLAAGAQAAGQQFIADFFFSIKSTRAMPMHSVPGLIDHF